MLLKFGIMALNAVVRASEIGPLATSGAGLPQAAKVNNAAADKAARVSLVFMVLVSLWYYFVRLGRYDT
ncbi:hypothetical protein l11_09060 [Neisseria weaveri LMG 5135]|nr:hypothetical protein l11_09060 [Neisseria weaveri LMG 5135]